MTVVICVCPFVGIKREGVFAVYHSVVIIVGVRIVSYAISVGVYRLGGVIWESVQIIRYSVVILVEIGLVRVQGIGILMVFYAVAVVVDEIGLGFVGEDKGFALVIEEFGYGYLCGEGF